MTIEDISTCFHDEINVILQRIHFSKTKKDILRWLENFNSEDRLEALQILAKVTFLSEGDLYERCDDILNEMITKVHACHHLYLVPVAKYGKSATHLTYYMEKSPVFRRLRDTQRLTYLVTEHEVINQVYDEKSVLVFFDDFFWYRRFIQKALQSLYYEV